MFYYLKGIIADFETNLAVIDCGGVGYACNTTSRTIGALKKGEEATLYTYCHIREDTFDIYGFFAKNELGCFKMLIQISGVGPKAALSLLSHTSPEDLALAILSENDKALTVAPGIGKKTAQRIILELKDKMSKELSELTENGVVFEGLDGSKTGDIAGDKASDVVAALSMLGYTSSEINSAMRKVDMMDLTTEQIIMEIVKNH